MHKFVGFTLLLLLAALPSRAQSMSGGASASYNAVTVSLTLDAGWTPPDYNNCDNINVAVSVPYWLSSVTWQVDGGPGGTVSGSHIQQTAVAPECTYNNYPDNQYTARFTFSDTAPGNRSLTVTATYSSDSGDMGQATVLLGYSVPGAVTQPNYYVLSIVYDPPGNQSTNGFTDSNSNGTMTTISKTFTEGTSFSFGNFLPLWRDMDLWERIRDRQLAVIFRDSYERSRVLDKVALRPH